MFEIQIISISTSRIASILTTEVLSQSELATIAEYIEKDLAENNRTIDEIQANVANIILEMGYKPYPVQPFAGAAIIIK